LILFAGKNISLRMSENLLECQSTRGINEHLRLRNKIDLGILRV
jgi:hypothetical protein